MIKSSVPQSDTHPFSGGVSLLILLSHPLPKLILQGTWEQLRQNGVRIKQFPSWRFSATLELHEPDLVNIHDRQIVVFQDKGVETVGSYKPFSNTHPETDSNGHVRNIHTHTKEKKKRPMDFSSFQCASFCSRLHVLSVCTTLSGNGDVSHIGEKAMNASTSFTE